LKLGEQYPNHRFYTKDRLIKYMSDALAKELRHESVANSEAFTFKADAETYRKEKYLAQIEDSKSTDQASQLKRKIVAVYNPDTAYKIITNCIFRGMIDDNIFEIATRQTLELTLDQDRTLLDQVRSIFGNEVSIEFKTAENHKYEVNKITPELNLGEEGSVWNKVSNRLLKHFGEAIHRSWFSKLKVDENNEKNNILKLKAPNNFFKDWVVSNYKIIIERFCEEEGFSCSEICV
jgi:hypothetical protein